MANTRELASFVGSRGFDDIIVGTDPKPEAITLELKEDSGKTYERGTILVKVGGAGDPKPISQALTSADVIFVLAETADVSDGDFVAEAYETGCFARQRLLTDGSYEMTQPDWDYMRQAGLLSRALLPVLPKSYE